MDRYDAAQDHYCYPGTDVLKNELGIQQKMYLTPLFLCLTPLLVFDQ